MIFLGSEGREVDIGREGAENMNIFTLHYCCCLCRCMNVNVCNNMELDYKR